MMSITPNTKIILDTVKIVLLESGGAMRPVMGSRYF